MIFNKYFIAWFFFLINLFCACRFYFCFLYVDFGLKKKIRRIFHFAGWDSGSLPWWVEWFSTLILWCYFITSFYIINFNFFLIFSKKARKEFLELRQRRLMVEAVHVIERAYVTHKVIIYWLCLLIYVLRPFLLIDGSRFRKHLLF